MFDLLTLAYRADITRVFTFMMAREVSNRTYTQVGVTEDITPSRITRTAPDKIEMLTQIQNLPHRPVRRFREEARRETPDGDGSLLDHYVLLYGSNMSNSNAARSLPAAERWWSAAAAAA